MDDEPPREPTVERVDRSDGRYVLYFSWPEAQAEPEPATRGAEVDDRE